jgi:hypothetical protein
VIRHHAASGGRHVLLLLLLLPQVGTCLVLHSLTLARQQEAGQQPQSLKITPDVLDHFQVRCWRCISALQHGSRNRGRQC